MRGRLAVAGIIAFAVILGSYLVYLAVPPYHWTLDPVDLRVYRWAGSSSGTCGPGTTRTWPLRCTTGAAT